jgi:serine protease Do
MRKVFSESLMKQNQKVRRFFLGWRAGAMMALAAVAVPAPAAPSKNPPAKLSIDESALPQDLKASTSYAPVIKKIAPSVVNIYSTTIVKDRGGMNPFLNDPFLRRFFGEDGPQMQPRARREQSLGSGVIVTSDGYILTANHVVEGADTVKVALVLPNGGGEQEFDAKVIGTDPPTDIALLRIDAKKTLPAITMGDSDKLEVGDTVLALGNPFGVGQTVTVGIASATGRGGFGITGYENFIQTDAAINPGNSGGALADAAGRLVGINTAILSRSGGFQGVGFAVPVSMARFVMERLIADGKVTRGYLGINIQPLTPELAKEFRLPDQSSGVLVGGVSPNSAAEKAGLKDGDVIVELNGKKVPDPRTLQLVVAQTAPGTKVNVRVLRVESGQKPTEKNLTATLGTLPGDMFSARSRGGQPDENQTTDALDGVEVADLDAQSRQEARIPKTVRSGALVVNVDPDSNSAEAGLRPGDVILQINHQAVHNAEEAVKLSESAKSNRILLQVWSRGAGGGQGGTRYIVVDNSKKK